MLAYDNTVVKLVNKAHEEFPQAVNKLPEGGGDMTVRLLVILATLVVIGWAIWQSKRTSTALKDVDTVEPELPVERQSYITR